MRLKRVFDVIVASVLLVPASLVMFLAMIAIRVSSPGPAVFSQRRVGRDLRPFNCYKLRTMHVGTPSLPTHEAAANWVTPVGRVLRRFKLDELPQLVNVVAGQMSLVGPRPCLPGQAELIEQRRQRDVFSLRPGITGLAQVRNIDMSDPVRCAQADAEYLERMTLGLDLAILLRTVCRGQDAAALRN